MVYYSDSNELFSYPNSIKILTLSYPAGICLFKINNGKPEQCVKSVQTWQQRQKNNIIGVTLVSLLFNWCCVFSSLHINHLIPWKKGYLTCTHLSKNGELNASSTEILCFGSRTSSFVIRSIVSSDALGYSLENGVGSLCGRRLM